MAKVIDAIRLFLLRLVFRPSVLADIQIEAKLQQVSTIALVRSVLEKYFTERTGSVQTRTPSMRKGGRTVHLKRENLNQPLVHMTPGEQK